MAMSIYELLKQDHEKVKGLFKQMQKKNQSPDAIFSQIQKELRVHFEGEEKLLYPALQGQDQTHEITLESIEEHSVAKRELEEVSKLKANDEWFNAKCKVLKELIDHHIEEEETQLFKKAKKVLSKEQAEDLAMKFEEEKHRLMAGMGKAQA